MTSPDATEMPWWRRVRLDWFLIALLVSATLGTLFPARGALIPTVDWTGTILIGTLFFLYGVRISPAQTWAGVKHWRLHGLVFGFTYLVFPIIGLALGWVAQHWLGAAMAMGIVYLSLVPSTVQSSVNFTAAAGGNVAAAVVSASLSNLLGVVVTPLLAMALIGGLGVTISAASIGTVALNILAPYVLGQLLRPWLKGFVNRHKRLKLVDQSSIIVIVYGAFSESQRTGIWRQTGPGQLALLVAMMTLLLVVLLVLTWFSGRWAGLDRADTIVVQMCGTKKSLMTGLPMAAIIFAGSELPLGLIALPLMIFHQVQLMTCGALAARYGRRSAELVAAA